MFDRQLELRVMCADQPRWIIGGFQKFPGYRIPWQPELHRLIIDAEGAAQHFCAIISRVLPHPDLLELQHAASFVVPVQHVLHSAGGNN